VLNGLHEGDYIATEGAFKLTENLLVYPQPASNQVVAGAM
jgi:hypothetical protein